MAGPAASSRPIRTMSNSTTAFTRKPMRACIGVWRRFIEASGASPIIPGWIERPKKITGTEPIRAIVARPERAEFGDLELKRSLGRVTPTVGQRQIGDILQVLVRDNNIEQALKFLKKKMQREGIFREMKRRSAYEKPSEKKVREKAEAIRRARKLARKTAIREGLIAAPKPRTPAPGRAKPAFAQG